MKLQNINTDVEAIITMIPKMGPPHWKISETPSKEVPIHTHEEWIGRAAIDLFEDTEDALCRMLISAIRTKIASFMMQEEIEKDQIVFCWRVEPEIHSVCGGTVNSMYARFYLFLKEPKND